MRFDLHDVKRRFEFLHRSMGEDLLSESAEQISKAIDKSSASLMFSGGISILPSIARSPQLVTR
jgi:hypothetical protein